MLLAKSHDLQNIPAMPYIQLSKSHKVAKSHDLMR